MVRATLLKWCITVLVRGYAADLQAYHLMKELLGLSADDMHAVFRNGMRELSSYLIEITADILAYKDEDGSPWLKAFSIQQGRREQVNGPSTALDEGFPSPSLGKLCFPAVYLPKKRRG